MQYTEEQNVRDLNIGDVVTLSDVWNGEGETPTDSYSYWLSEENNIETSINYEFEFLAADAIERIHERKFDSVDEILNLKVRITNIELI